MVKRVSLPEDMLPDGADVEITAKIAAGYNDFQEDEDEMQLKCIKKRCAEIRENPSKFNVSTDKLNSLIGAV